MFASKRSVGDPFPRDLQPEWMDQPGLSEEAHRRALGGLARLNRFTRVAHDMYRQIRHQTAGKSIKRLRVLDVASGSGDLPIQWLRWSKRDGLDWQVCALDLRSTAVLEQQTKAKQANVSLRSVRSDCIRDPLPDGFDIVTNSLFMHHLQDNQAIHLIRSMMHAARVGVLICDLERSRWNLRLVNAAARVLTRSEIVHHDADRSVRAAYRTGEFARLATAACASKTVPRRLFPCRFLLSLPGFAGEIKSDESRAATEIGTLDTVS